MKRNLLVLAVVTLFLTASVAGAAEPFKLGCITPLTGASAGAGVHIKYGIELAVEEINAAGGVAGRKVELIMVDDAGIPAQSVSAANKLIYQDNVDFIIGGNVSSTVLAHMQVIEKAGVPYICTTASNAQITRPENKWTVRLHQNDDIQSVHLADFLVSRLGKKTIAVMHDTGDYGVGCKDAFIARLEELKIKPAMILGFNPGDKDFMSQLIRIRQKNPDTIAIFGQIAEGAIITNQMRQLGMDALICTTGGFVVPKYIELAPGTSEGAVGITTFSPFTDDSIGRTFVANVQKRYNTVPTHHAWNTYEAAKFIMKPIVDEVGSDKEDMRQALRSWKWTVMGVEKHFDENGQVVMPSQFIEVRDETWVPFVGQ